MHDDVDEGNTAAILNEYRRTPLEVVFFVQDGGLERSAPVAGQYGIRRLRRSIERLSRWKLY